MTMSHVRADFPVLSQQVHGKPLVYLDSAATSQKPLSVIQAMRQYYEYDNANVHRGIHALAERATVAYEATRTAAARFIGAPHPDNIVFTRGTTESLNMVAYGWGDAHIRSGDEIVITAMEHHSNLIPWQQLARRTGAVLRHIPLTPDGRLDWTPESTIINDKTRLVAMTHVSNVLGTVNPVRAIADAARAVGALVVVDAAQSVPHMPVDVKQLGCDFMAFSAHKMCGPTGVGILYGTDAAFAQMQPVLYGGEMIDSVTLTEATWKEGPHRFEAGTPHIAGVVGFGAALEYLNDIGMDAVLTHEKELTAYTIDRIQDALPDTSIYGPADRVGLVCFNINGVHPHDLAQLLDREGVAIRAGHHCAQPLMRWLDVSATARASLYLYNTKDDVEALVSALVKAREFFA